MVDNEIEVNYHVKNIDALIPVAERDATLQVAALGKESELRRGADGKMFKWDFWTEFFHAAMNRKTIARGLRVDFRNNN